MKLANTVGNNLYQLLCLLAEYIDDGADDDVGSFLNRYMGGIGAEGGSAPAVQSLREALYAAINSDTTLGNAQEEITLVDRIEDILSREGSRNVLTAQTLDNLRKALMSPSERSNLIAKLNDAEAGCSICGHPFEVGEAIVYVRERNAPRFVCGAGAPATSMGCAVRGCKNHISIPSAFSKHRMCKDHTGGGAEVAEMDEVAAMAENPFGVGHPIRPFRDSADMWQMLQVDLPRIGVTRPEPIAVTSPGPTASGGAPSVVSINPDRPAHRWATSPVRIQRDRTREGR